MMEFRPLTIADLSMLHEWLNRPHLRDYYQKEPISLEEVTLKFLPRITGICPVYNHIVWFNGNIIGKMQCYRNTDHLEYANEVGLNDGISVDLFIANPYQLGCGMGRIMLKEYVHDIAFNLYPEENACYVCHDLTNVRARKCSLAAGFKFLRPVVENDVDSELLVMYRKNK